MNEARQNHVKARRSHRKSRLGCANCKRRRIKCDEKRPTCSNCANHEIECTFAIVNSGIQSQTSASSGSEPIERPRPTQFRPYQYPTGKLKQTFGVSKTSNGARPLTQSTGTQCCLSSIAPVMFSPADLQLFYHYLMSTCKSMAVNNQPDRWQDDLVKWGFDFPPILHLILALSALHLAYENPESRHHYVQQADNHLTFGIQAVTRLLSQLNTGNCQKIYMCASMICFIYFGHGPRPGEYLIFSETGPSEWLVLMRGVKLIMANYHNNVFSGKLAPKSEVKEEPSYMTPELRAEFHEHTLHTEAIQRLVQQQVLDMSSRSIHLSALDDLLEVIRGVYKKAAVGKTGLHLMHLVIGWLYRRPEEFVSLVEQKQPCALIIVASWSVLLNYMESSWLMKGWARHVLSGISAFLHPDSRPWIEFPLQKMQRVGEGLPRSHP